MSREEEAGADVKISLESLGSQPNNYRCFKQMINEHLPCSLYHFCLQSLRAFTFITLFDPNHNPLRKALVSHFIDDTIEAQQD